MLKIGWSTCDITPKRPAMLQGQMHVRIARSTLDPLTATAWVIEDPRAGECAIFVSMDIAYVCEVMKKAICDRIRKEMPGIPSDKIIMNATHTHTAMVYDDIFYPHPGGDVMTGTECRDWLIDNIVQLIRNAWKDRRPRLIGRAYGHAVVAHNRYCVLKDGSAYMYGNTNRPEFSHIGGYVDHSMDMLFTWNPDGTLAGMTLAIPCPSQVDEHLNEFSADYWHEIRVELRSRFGSRLQILPICSTAGDQSPHFLLYAKQEAEMLKLRGVSERQEIAQRVGAAVERALVCTPPIASSATTLKHIVKPLKLTPLTITPAHIAWAKARYAEFKKSNNKAALKTWFPLSLKEVINAEKKKMPKPPFDMDLHVVRIGDAVIATNPFELFLDYGLRIKARSVAAQTITMQLAAGRGMYLPTKQALEAGGYGANPVVATVGWEGGEQLVEATLAAIGKVFPKGA